MNKRAPAVEEPHLPNDLEAERAVLGAVLLNNTTYETLAGILKPEHFFREAHRIVFLAFARLLERPAGSVDLLTLRAELDRMGRTEEAGGAVYLAGLIDGVPRSTNATRYAGIVKDASRHRDLIRLGNKLTADAYAAEDSPEAILTWADKELLKLHAQRNDGLVSLSTSSHGVLDRLEWRHAHKGELTGVPSGFKSIDELTMGWQPGNFIIVAARPSVGKTIFAMNAAMHASRTLSPRGDFYKGAVFSLEMKRPELEDRIVSSLSGIPLTRLINGFILEHEWAPLSQAIGTMGESGLYINDSGAMTLHDIRRECRKLKTEQGLDFVVIDYVQLMSGAVAGRYNNRTELMSEVSRGLKLLAGELYVPVIVLSQLNRSSENRADPEPKLSDLRDTGAFEQDTDIVAFLHRAHHLENGVTQFIFGKQRNGAGGRCNLTVDRDIVTFTDGGEATAPLPPPERTDAEKHAAKVRAIRARKARSK